VRRCVICGSTFQVQANHLGGKNHLAWFTMPFCGQHHDRFHVLVRQAGIDLTYTEDPIERIRRALSAIKIAEWMLLEWMLEEGSNKKVQGV
jgi:hypothetical protein